MQSIVHYKTSRAAITETWISPSGAARPVVPAPLRSEGISPINTQVERQSASLSSSLANRTVFALAALIQPFLVSHRLDRCGVCWGVPADGVIYMVHEQLSLLTKRQIEVAALVQTKRWDGD